MDNKEANSLSLLERIVGLDNKPRFEIVTVERCEDLKKRVQSLNDIEQARKHLETLKYGHLEKYGITPENDIEAEAFGKFLHENNIAV